MVMTWIAAYCGQLAGFVLLAAGAAKIAHPAQLELIIKNYRLVPDAVARAAAHVLPWLEAGTGVWLVSQQHSVVAAAAAASLFMLFAAAIAVNLLRGRSNISCGCFGSATHAPLSWAQVCRNVVFAGFVLLALQPSFRQDGAVSVAISDRLAASLAAGVTLACLWLATTTQRMLRGTAVDVR
jgi:Methylamine utilisation protein MauE